MNKKFILLFAVVFGAIGSYVPVIMGIDNGMGGWIPLGSLIGGLIGIFIGVWISKRF